MCALRIDLLRVLKEDLSDDELGGIVGEEKTCSVKLTATSILILLPMHATCRWVWF